MGANRDGWRDWWEFNKDQFIWERRSSMRSAVVTSGGTALTQRGRRAALGESLSRGRVYTRVVPTLLSILEDGPKSEEDPRVLDAAARSLGVAVAAPFDAPVVEALLPLLRHEYDEVKVAAALALGLLGPGESGTLLALARGKDDGERLVKEKKVPTEVRSVAALALGFADDPATVLPLIDLVEDPREKEAVVQTSAVHALGLMRNERVEAAGGYLLRKLADKRLDPMIRAAIPTALGRLGRVDAVGPLLDVLGSRNTDPCVLQSAVIGLGQLANLEHDDVLRALMEIIEDDEDDPTRHFALMSVALIGARDAHPQQNAAAHRDIQEFLTRTLERCSRIADHPWAGLATGVYVYGHPAARARLAEPLLSAYDDMNDPLDKSAFALALGLAGVDSAAPRLVTDFERLNSNWFRGFAALGLGFLAHRDAADMLIDELEDERRVSGFRDLALACLLMGDPQVTASMTTAVTEHFDRAVVEGTRTELAGALEVLRVNTALPPLERALENEDLDELRRAWACAAMERLTEVSTRPWYSRILANSNYAVPLDRSLRAVR